MKRKRPIRFPDAKSYAESFEIKKLKNNHYFRSLLDPENRWCVLVQFEIFEQIWGTVKDSLKNFENYKCFAFDLSTYYYMKPTCKISKKKCMLAKLLVVRNWGNMAPCSNQQQQGLLLEISYIPLLSIMTLHYHRLYKISSLEANLSLQDMKQLFQQKPMSQVNLPKN